MKKILFVITQSEFGGAQRFLWNLISGLTQIMTQNNAEELRVDPRSYPRKSASIEYEIVVAAGPEGDDKQGLLSFLEKKGINTKHLKYLRRAINPLFDYWGTIEISKLIKKEKPDTLFLCSSKAGFLGSLAAHLYRRKTQIVTQNNAEDFGVNLRNYPRKSAVSPKVIYRIGGWTFNDPWSFWQKLFYKFIEKVSARWKDIIIVNAECHRKQAIELGIKPREKILTIYNGIDVNKLEFLNREEARNRLKVRSSGFVVGTIANLYPTKGFEHLIKAARLVINSSNLEPRTSSITFIVIGEGMERKKLEKLIKKYRLENNFILAGAIPSAYRYLKAFDIFVLPSVKEGLPWTILETMAGGVPIVSTTTGGIPEVLENMNSGLLVKPKKPKQLAEAIQKLIENKNLREKLANQAREKVEKEYSLQKMVKQIERIL